MSPSEAERVVDGIRKLVDRCGSQTAVEARYGIKQRTQSKVLKGEGFPGPRLAEQVAAALGVTATELRTGRVEAPPLRAIAGWSDAEAEAQSRFPHIPREAWERIGELRTAHPPERVSPEFVLQMALAWTTGMARAPEERARLEAELGRKKP